MVNETHRSERGRTWLWLILGLTLALGVVVLVLFKLMDGSWQDDDGERSDAAEAAAEAEGPHMPRAEPQRPAGAMHPGAGPRMHRSAARYREYLKHVKRDAAPEPWEESEGDGPKSPVTVAVAGTSEGINADVILASKKLQPKIASCYRRRLRARPNLGGKIFVSFTLADNGEHRSVVDKSRILVSKVKDVPMETCVLRAISTFVLPGPLASATKWHHLTFALAPGANKDLFPRQLPPEPVAPAPQSEPEPEPKHPPEPQPKHPPGPEPEPEPEPQPK